MIFETKNSWLALSLMKGYPRGSGLGDRGSEPFNRFPNPSVTFAGKQLKKMKSPICTPALKRGGEIEISLIEDKSETFVKDKKNQEVVPLLFA